MLLDYDDLLERLTRSYNDAPDRKKIDTMILFGIKHADDLRPFDTDRLRELSTNATGRRNLAAEIRKGVRLGLADYVELNDEPYWLQ